MQIKGLHSVSSQQTLKSLVGNRPSEAFSMDLTLKPLDLRTAVTRNGSDLSFLKFCVVLSHKKYKIWGKLNLGTPPCHLGVDFLVFFKKNKKYLESPKEVQTASGNVNVKSEITWKGMIYLENQLGRKICQFHGI